MINSKGYSGRFTPDVNRRLYDRACFWYRALFRTASGVFKLEGDVPDTLNETYFWHTLIRTGSIIMQNITSDTKGFPKGIYCLSGTHPGLDPYMFPVEANIVNAVLGERPGTNGVDAIWIRYNQYGEPATDIINQYAETLALLDLGMEVNVLNTFTDKVFKVDNDAQAQQVRAMYDQVSAGNPAVITKKSMKELPGYSELWSANTPYLVHDYIADEISVKSKFLSEFGVMSNQFEKAERLISSEVKTNLQELAINKAFYLNAINHDLDRCNALFGTNLHAVMALPDEDTMDFIDTCDDGEVDNNDTESEPTDA